MILLFILTVQRVNAENMMEALDQQQAKLTSNRDDGEARTGSGTGSEVGATTGGGGGAAGEEDDFEEPHHALGLAEEESENNNAQEEKGEGKRKKSADDVIDLTLANGQDCRDMPEEETEPTEESPLDGGEATITTENEASLLVPADAAPSSTYLVKQELADDIPEELVEPAKIPHEEFLGDIKLKTEVVDQADLLSDNQSEFLSDAEEQPVDFPVVKRVSEAAESAVDILPQEAESEEMEEKYFPSVDKDSESEDEEQTHRLCGRPGRRGDRATAEQCLHTLWRYCGHTDAGRLRITTPPGIRLYRVRTERRCSGCYR